jgi:two-component system phosphate regulon sensor histidine kinase PhoR
VAFLVNLDWVRRNYFAELLPQIMALAGGQGEVSLSISDGAGQLVATTGNEAAAEPAMSRAFPLLFFDERLARPATLSAAPIQRWSATVRPARAVALATETAGLQTFLLIACAAVAALVSLLLVLRATRAQAELAGLKSDFVSTVTHELKTPLALIKLVGETLEKGRYTSADVVREYATLLSQETARLGQLIDNLLTLSRVSNLRQPYTFESLDPAELVDDTLHPFWPRLKALGFDVRIDVPPSLSPIRADRTAMRQVLGNLVDNAIKYAGTVRTLCIEGSARERAIVIAVADSGAGIPEQDLERVFDKFFRGRATRASGSGLGLTIARRVVEAHGGRISIESLVGEGTRVEVSIPQAEA